MASQNVIRGLKTARKAALLSTSYHRVGAAIFKGKRLLSVSWNSNKSHPDSTTVMHGHHAEFSALNAQYKFDLTRSTIYVVRITRGKGIDAISKPCKECMRWIKAAGIKRIVYLDRQGNPVEERV